MELHNAIYERRAVRDYVDSPLEHAVIERLIYAAIQAPTALNQQPWIFTVVRNQRILEELSTQAKTYMLSQHSGLSLISRTVRRRLNVSNSDAPWAQAAFGSLSGVSKRRPFAAGRVDRSPPFALIRIASPLLVHPTHVGPLSPQTLANLVWAAFGINRQKGPFGLKGRTAASASNSQEIEVYVALSKGTYRYDPCEQVLVPIVSGDLRPFAIGRGQSHLPYGAATRLIYVANVNRLVNTEGFAEPGLKDPEVQRSYYYIDTGLIAANVYLFAASTGLAAWFHNCDRDALFEKLGLRDNQRVLFAQTVGYPRRKRRSP